MERRLRSWKHGELWDSDVEQDDDFIIQCAKKLNKERGKMII